MSLMEGNGAANGTVEVGRLAISYHAKQTEQGKGKKIEGIMRSFKQISSGMKRHEQPCLDFGKGQSCHDVRYRTENPGASS